MNTKTRLKLGLVCFFSMLAMAVLKNWLPGISEGIVLGAAVPIAGYIFGETIRPSKK